MFVGALFFLIVPITCGVVLSVFIYTGLGQDQEVLKTGTSTDGEVTKVTEDQSTSVNEEHPFKVDFKYTVDGTEKTAESDVWKKPGEDIAVGQKVEVKYQGDKAVIADLKLVDFRWLAVIPVGVGLIFSFIGLVFTVVLVVGGLRKA